MPQTQAASLDPERYATYEDYVAAQYRLWFGSAPPADEADGEGWRSALPELLRSHFFFQNLLKIIGGNLLDYRELLQQLERVTPELKDADPGYRINLLNSLLALVSEARTPEGRPFLQIRLQWWLRELRRMVASVESPPRLAFFDDLDEEQRKKHLPVVHCRECGSIGWSAIKPPHSGELGRDLQAFYVGFFSSDPKVTYLFPEDGELSAIAADGMMGHLCPSCLSLSTGLNPSACASCGHEGLIRVFVPDNRVATRSRVISTQHCPYCGGHDSLTLLGSRAASLTSVLIAQLFGSAFNDDKKLLTLSDSVQDAAHRAGFFGAQTWRFNFRTALFDVIEDDPSVSLAELAARLVHFWRRRMDDETFIATFIAPNMLWLADYGHLLKVGKVPEGSNLAALVAQRAAWETICVFRMKLDTDSTANWTLGPAQTGH